MWHLMASWEEAGVLVTGQDLEREGALGERRQGL